MRTRPVWMAWTFTRTTRTGPKELYARLGFRPVWTRDGGHAVAVSPTANDSRRGL